MSDWKSKAEGPFFVGSGDVGPTRWYGHYATLGEAEGAAADLSKSNPGTRFIITKRVAQVITHVPTEWAYDQEDDNE